MFTRSIPIKLGYKFWYLCSSEGNLFNFNPYLKKDVDQPKELLGIKVVNKLTEVLPSDEKENYELFFDHLFSKMGIMTVLKGRKMKSIGTIRENCLKSVAVGFKANPKKKGN